MRRPRAIFLGLVVALSGCATWSKHGIEPRPPEKVRVALLPVEVGVVVKRLRSIESLPKSGKPPADEKGLIRAEMLHAADRVTSDLEGGLRSSYFFELAPDSDVRRALEAEGLSASTSTPSGAELQALGRAVGAQAVFVPRLSGYGAVKKRWLVLLIGTGLAEGLAQGVAVAAVVSNPWVAVGVGSEEAAQETAEWGGGAFLFDRFYSPVILEGRLVSVADGRDVWSATALASGNRKALKALPKAERGKREVRLRLTARKAAADLVKKLDKKAWSNLKTDRMTP